MKKQLPPEVPSTVDTSKRSINLPSSVLIDPTKEPLKEILPFYRGITHVPSEIDGPALMVFIELQKCFDKAGKVCEGLLGNVIWGFQQVGYDAKHILAGLSSLRQKGYIYYSFVDGSRVSDIAAVDRPLWIRFDKKMKELFVQVESKSNLILDEGVSK